MILFLLGIWGIFLNRPKSILCESTEKKCIPKINLFSQSVTSTGTIYNSTDRIFCSNDHPSVNYNPITTINFLSTIQRYS
jgi:hypothetical protein